MDTKLHDLPPLKRLRLLEQESQASMCPLLPTKKRKESRDPQPIFSNSVTAAAPITCCLPAKKRVWAPPPDSSLTKPATLFDLNVEYNSLLKEEEGEPEKTDVTIPLGSVANPSLSDKEDDSEERVDSRNKGGEGDGNGENDGVVVDDGGDDDGIVCAVCGSTDGDPLDPIVFCDGCDLMVHATCYGNPLVKGVPEGDWFCSQCLVSQSSRGKANNRCCLCPVMGGALKPTNNGQWAHVICALLVPEVFFEDPEGRDGINCSKVPKRRWKEVCYVCNGRNGCAVECSELNCPLAFHVTCGLKEGLCIEYREGKKKGAIVAGFCRKHTELWKEQQRTGKFRIVARDEGEY
ncbi:hypothetical protein Ancab_004087 [Ancistrocladus abbreviatus]